MFLKNIKIENVAAIKNIDRELPFSNDLPLPIIFVGENGSGKSTVVSIIANAVMSFKSQVFKNCEVNDGYVYRLRSPGLITHGKSYSHTKVDFDKGFWCEEWILSTSRENFEKADVPKPTDDSWRNILANEYSEIRSHPQRKISLPPDITLKAELNQKVNLYFPSERYELPYWVNENQVREGVRFHNPQTSTSEETPRTFFTRAILVETLEWLRSLCLDSKMIDRKVVNLPVQTSDGNTLPIPYDMPVVGSSTQLINAVCQVLASILQVSSAQLAFGPRKQPTVSVRFTSSNEERLVNLQSLSAGQISLFCLFCSILRDADLTSQGFTSMEDISGCVLVDEIDKHLHIELQTKALPQLIKKFPSIQFVMTANAPFFMMGMETYFDSNSFQVIELPNDEVINTEAYAEFSKGFEAFERTARFNKEVLQRVQLSVKPVVIFEGKTDITHVKTAWRKLYAEREMPFHLEHAGGPGQDRGGAQMLKLMLEASCMVCDRRVLGVFDHDTEGKNQFCGLSSGGFTSSDDDALRRTHPERDVEAILLPVPDNRKIFVNESANRCYLALEHYYEDTILCENNVAGETVVADSVVFPILENSKSHRQSKTKFSEKVKDFEKQAFSRFMILFDRIESILGSTNAVEPECASKSLVDE
ncbi:MAG: AAA family ATPase [Cyanobacteria bacterium P01_C01_bin.118]